MPRSLVIAQSVAWNSPLRALLPDDFDGAMCVNRDSLRNATQEETIHPSATMGTQNNQVRPPGFCGVQDDRSRFAQLYRLIVQQLHPCTLKDFSCRFDCRTSAITSLCC